MAWTEQDLREIEDELKKGSQGVGDVPEAESLDGITSLPAYQEVEGQDMPKIVRAPLTLLAAPALEAADKANAAATKAESDATAAQTAANSANEKAGLAAQAASNANAAKEGAEAATQSANNAASNAEEKAAAANTAAQDAEKVANNPTYIGKDHYVYVYNKDTESFDKTDIYCKGEPGSSFRVAGEYATLEALKSAVPDGSAVDGFMAVGTEAPYDYYAWVNGEWVSQGKIGGIDEAPTDGKAYGRKNGDWAEVPEKSDVIILPKEILDLTGSSSSEEILAAFGGIDKYKDLLEKLSTNNCLVQIGEPSLGSLRHIYTLVEYAVNFASNKQSGALSLNIYNEEQQLRRLHFYSENNGTTARCGEASTFQLVRDTDVLTKTNTSSFTPTQPYHPATKKYVDDSIKESLYYVNNDKFLSYFITPAYRIDSDAEDSIIMCFNTIDKFNAFVDKAIDAGVTLVFINKNLNEKIYIRDYHVYRSNNNNRELSFIFNYSNNGESFQFITTRVFISYNASYGYKFVVKNLISSDNLTTITKKTAAEYEAIGSKDANTAYCVTD